MMQTQLERYHYRMEQMKAIGVKRELRLSMEPVVAKATELAWQVMLNELERKVAEHRDAQND